MEANRSEMESVVADLTAQLSQLSAQLRLLTAQGPSVRSKSSPWLPLREAAELLHFSSPRALKYCIVRGGFPPDCYRRMPSPSGKRHA